MEKDAKVAAAAAELAQARAACAAWRRPCLGQSEQATLPLQLWEVILGTLVQSSGLTNLKAVVADICSASLVRSSPWRPLPGV